MKKLSYRQINNVMGKEMAPIQRKFMKSRNVQLSPEQEQDLKDKGIKKSNKPEPFTHGNKPNNNDLCPCGSGRKFKHCCKF